MARLLTALLCSSLVCPALAAPKLQEQAEEAKKQLAGASDSKEKIAALERIGEIGQIRITYVKPVVPDVFKLLKDSDAKVRGAAAETLGKLDPDLDEALPALTKLLEDKEDSVKMSAAQGLANIGPKAQPAVKDLRAAMTAAEDDNRLRGAMRRAIRTITGR